jgi:hypothetical protein
MKDHGDPKRLMSESIDRPLGPEEAARLASHLTTDPEAKAQLEAARVGAQAMMQLGSVPIPEGLRQEIQRSVTCRPRAIRGSARRLAGWREAFLRRPALGLVPAFAVGVLVGIAIFTSVMGPRPPLPGGSLPVGGTMRSPDGASCAKLLERTDLGSADFSAWRCGDHLTVTVGVKSEATSRIDLAFDATALQPVSVRWPEGVEGIMEAGPGFVRLTPRGVASCDVDLIGAENATGTIDLVVFDGGETRRANLQVNP